MFSHWPGVARCEKTQRAIGRRGGCPQRRVKSSDKRRSSVPQDEMTAILTAELATRLAYRPAGQIAVLVAPRVTKASKRTERKPDQNDDALETRFSHPFIGIYGLGGDPVDPACQGTGSGHEPSCSAARRRRGYEGDGVLIAGSGH